MKTKGKLPTPTVFEEIASYWSEIADANNTEEQINFLTKVIKVDGLVLDLACGTGRHAAKLGKKGYRVVGLDLSRRLLQMAKEKALEAGITTMLVRADMRFLPFCSEVFASVVSLDSSYGYLPSEKEDLQSFKEVSRILRNRGVFLIDLFNGAKFAKRHEERLYFNFWSLIFGLLLRFHQIAYLFRWRDYPSFRLLQKRSLTDRKRKLRDLWVIQDKKTGKIAIYRHVVRLYVSMRLDSILRDAGFQSTRFYGDYSGQGYSEYSKRLAVIARKQKEDTNARPHYDA